jgi:hypothetical protein
MAIVRLPLSNSNIVARIVHSKLLEYKFILQTWLFVVVAIKLDLIVHKSIVALFRHLTNI